MMRKIVTFVCTVLLVAGLSSCEKMIPEIDLAGNLEGDWQKVYQEGVQDGGQVIWSFTAGNTDPHSWVLSIYVSDVFSGDSEAQYIYAQHQNGYPGIGSSTPELYLYEIDHDFKAEDWAAAFTPAAHYWVKECSKDKLVLQREDVNVDGPNLIEGDVTFRRMGLYTK